MQLKRAISFPVIIAVVFTVLLLAALFSEPAAQRSKTELPVTLQSQ